MEVVNASYLPGDPRLIDQIVYELKSQGIFDQFRKECIADVDTKPAYQNLRQRVEGSVAGFLRKQSWRPDMNKNHVREMLRKNIYESGFLETGVERIVDQVVNPKINSVFLPKVEDVFYRYLGIERPNRSDDKKDALKINVDDNSLLPTDLEAVSPESVHSEGQKKIDKSEEDVEDLKMEEDESPPFEPLEQKPVLPQEESSVDSHLSGFSGLASHDSNHSIEPKTTPMEVSNQDSQLSKQSSDDHLSIVTSDENNTKMDVCDDSRQSKSSKSHDSNTKFNFSQINTNSENSSEQNNKAEEKKSSDKDKDKRSSSKHRSRHDSRDHRDGKEHKENKDSKERKDSRENKSDRDKKSSKEKHSSSSKDSKDYKDREKDRTRDSKNKSDKTKDGKDREHKNDKERDRSKSSSRHNSTSRDKSNSKRDSVGSSKDREKDKSKSSSRDHKDTKHKEKSSDENRSKNDKEKSDESKGKNEKGHGDSKSKEESKSSSKKSSSKSERDKKDEKRHSHNYDNKQSSSGSKNKEKDKKDSKKDSKGTKDDHFSSKDKKSDRRSTDRDSNDGHSGNKSTSNSFTSSSSGNTNNQKDSQESSGSISGGSGDSRTSDSVESEVLKTPVTILTSNIENNEIVIASPKAIINNNNEVQQFKLIKPKFATNIHEARRLMKIRKQLDKLEKQRQNEYESLLLGTVDKSAKEKQNGLLERSTLNVTSVTEENVKLDAELKSVSPPLSGAVSKDSWDAIEAQLNKDVTTDYSANVDESEQEIVQAKTCDGSSENVDDIEDTNECCYLNEEIPKMAEAFLDYATGEMEKLNKLLEHFCTKKKSPEKSGAVKRKLTDEYSDVTNNNKYNNNVIKGDKKEQKKNNVAKLKKTNHISAQNENFALPLSPADGELSNKKIDPDSIEKPKRTTNRTSTEKSQRYSNDDLYKPRPFIRGSRSRSGKSSVD